MLNARHHRSHWSSNVGWPERETGPVCVASYTIDNCGQLSSLVRIEAGAGRDQLSSLAVLRLLLLLPDTTDHPWPVLRLPGLSKAEADQHSHRKHACHRSTASYMPEKYFYLKLPFLNIIFTIQTTDETFLTLFLFHFDIFSVADERIMSC